MIDLKIIRLWFFSTPYTLYRRGLHGAYLDACDVGARVVDRYKITLISPILNSHGMAFHGILPAKDGKFWKRFNAPILEACGGCLVAKMDGWEESVGIANEILDSRAAKKMVVFVDPITLELE